MPRTSPTAPRTLSGAEPFNALNLLHQLTLIRTQDQLIAAQAMLRDLTAADRADRGVDSFRYEETLRLLVETYVAQTISQLAAATLRLGDGEVLAFLAASRGPTTLSVVGDAAAMAPELDRLSAALTIPPANLRHVLRGRLAFDRAEVAKLAVHFQVSAAVFSALPWRFAPARPRRFAVLRLSDARLRLRDLTTMIDVALDPDCDYLGLVDCEGAGYRPDPASRYYVQALSAHFNRDPEATLRRFFPARWAREREAKPRLCAQCGAAMIRNGNGTTNHLKGAPHDLMTRDEIDYDKDADHVAIADHGDDA